MVLLKGEERAENQMPMKSFFDAGVVVTSASDCPVINPAYPLIGMQKGVLRQIPGSGNFYVWMNYKSYRIFF